MVLTRTITKCAVAWVGCRPFLIMLVKLAFYTHSNTLFMPQSAQIVLDSQNNATLVLENALFYFKQNVQTQASCCVLIIN